MYSAIQLFALALAARNVATLAIYTSESDSTTTLHSRTPLAIAAHHANSSSSTSQTRARQPIPSILVLIGYDVQKSEEIIVIETAVLQTNASSVATPAPTMPVSRTRFETKPTAHTRTAENTAMPASPASYQTVTWQYSSTETALSATIVPLTSDTTQALHTSSTETKKSSSSTETQKPISSTETHKPISTTDSQKSSSSTETHKPTSATSGKATTTSQHTTEGSILSIVPVTVLPTDVSGPHPGWQTWCNNGGGFKMTCSLYAPGTRPTGGRPE